jgi:succinoglycan biosynthesis protein ExoA
MPPSDPFVSIVIPCRNERSHIQKCLSSTLAQVAPAGGFEIIVADGASDDGTAELLQAISSNDPRVKCIRNPARFTSSGLNAAVQAARGSIIVRMDAHTEYAPDYVQQCVEVLKQSGADNVGGPACTRADTYVQKAIAAAYHSPFSVGGARFHNVNFEGYVDTVTYGCWPRSTFEKFGLFDEELIRNQDDEHNLRIIRGGGKIWQSPKIKSWYRPRSSLAALFNQYMQYGYWKVRVIQKHKLPASWRHLVPAAFLLVLIALFLLSAFCFLFSGFRFPFSVFRFEVSDFRFPVSGLSLAFPAALSAYLLAIIAASLLTAAQAGWKLLPALPAVFACYHFGYGYGFLRGIWHFVIRKGQKQTAFSRLTR